MSSYHHTYFLDPQAAVWGGASPYPCLHIGPDGQHGAGLVGFQFPYGMSGDDALTVADRFVDGVTAWRDEIARLKAGAGESDE